MMLRPMTVRRKVAIFLLSVTSIPLMFVMTAYYHDSLTIPIPLRALRLRTGLLPTESSNDTAGSRPHLNSSNAGEAINTTRMDDKTLANASLNANIDQRTGIANNNNGSEVVDTYIYSKQSLAKTALGEGLQAAGEVNGSVSILVNNGEMIVEEIKTENTSNEEHRIAATLPIRDLSGYVSVVNLKKQIQMHCSKCAYVSSSGQLRGTNAGTLIDSFPCILRMNDAPIQGFEDDVGSKTTVRVVAHSAGPSVNLKKKALLKGVGKPKVLLMWGPAKVMATNGKGRIYNLAKSLALEVAKDDMQVFMLSDRQVNYADQTFEKETGVNRMSSGSWLSTGWFTMMFARAVCDEINVFGMVNEDHCRKYPDSKVPYHYYQPTLRTECAFYKSNEGAKAHAHRFMTEKSIFARWSKQEPEMIFHHPNWTATQN